jgi:hypothetical protein
VLLHDLADVRSDGLTTARILPATVYPAVKLNVEIRGFALGLANHAAARKLGFFRTKLRILFPIYGI